MSVHGRPHHGDNIEADLVCEACSTVNDPGTLLCRECGNNLRDQRVRRLIQGAEAEVVESGPSRAAFLRGALTVFAILLVLWVALNVNQIANWVVRAESTARGETFWSGAEAPVFDALLQEIDGHPISPDQVDAAEKGLYQVSGLSGHYILKQNDPYFRAVIGQACVREEGGKLYIVAKLDEGGELRGVGTLDSGNRMSSTLIAYHSGRIILDGVGYATTIGNGQFRCIGMSDMSNDQIDVFAYRIP